MPAQIPKSLADQFAFNLAGEVQVFKDAVAAHALTVDVPAPTHPIALIEHIVLVYGGDFTIVDDAEPDPPAPGV